jgi:hypothetical protein
VKIGTEFPSRGSWHYKSYWERRQRSEGSDQHYAGLSYCVGHTNLPRSKRLANRHRLASVNYFFRRIASLDLLPPMGHCLTAIVTEGSGGGRQEWHEHLREWRGRN